MGFVTGPHVLVRQFDEKTWTLEEPVVYRGRTDEFVVPEGTRTDFASVPRVFAWLVPPYGLFTAAAVLHDHLWRVLVPAGVVTPVDADGLFRRAMRELGVPFLIRWFMWGAVRWAALAGPGRRRGWLGELPRLALVTLAALPVVTVPAVAIALGFAVFAVLEQVAYLLLLLVRTVRPSDKQINRPRPDLRT
ncbi:DUF1353 domain-containing protein [Pseudonocardia nigra]|uniref:DUF1353 domain-containing protein n=1 Tax=Pseudonocardia nigra TaxID=1921578 RepID=UPI001C5DC112|nr:DUF1353 domain-containing protein [Pseudonocardia nigra]